MAPAKKPKAEKRMIDVGTPNVKGYTHRVEAAPYEAMKKILLRALPKGGPGLTQTEMVTKCGATSPRGMFPTPGKVQWWVKCVQLDLESKGELARVSEGGRNRWHRTK